jgi:SSS family solute:Na+ symporter
MNEQLIDIGIAIIYILAVTAIGLGSSRREMKSKEGYFLGGKSFTWVMIGTSLFATHISSMQFIGQSGFAYEIGIAAANPQTLGAFTLGISAAFFIPVYLRQGMYTIPKYLELRFNKEIKVFYSCIIVLTTLLNSPFALYAAGLAALELLGISQAYLPHLCFLIGGTVGLYAVIGGLKSVVVTDVIQTFILCTGGILVLVLGINEVGGLGVLYDKVGATHMEFLLPSNHPTMPWTVVISGMLIGSISWSVADSAVLQRALGAKDLRNAKNGMVLCSFLKILAVFIIAFPGVVAAALYTGVKPDATYPMLVADVLPVGLSGLVMAGLLAALMSSADSGLTSVSSLVAIEIWPAIKKNPSERQSLFVGRTSGIIHLSFSIIAAPFVGELGLIFPLVLKIAGYLLGPLGIIFILSRMVKRVNDKGALAVMGTGFAIGLYMTLCTTIPPLKVLVPQYLLEISFFEIQTYLAIFYAIILLTVSHLTPAPSSEKTDFLDLTEEEKNLERNTPLLKSFRFWYGLMLICLVVLYLVF